MGSEFDVGLSSPKVPYTDKAGRVGDQAKFRRGEQDPGTQHHRP